VTDSGATLYFGRNRSDRDALLALHIRGDSSGQEIGRAICNLRGRDESLNSATIYSSLGRLADKGLITCEEDESDRRANVYQLTRDGEAAVMAGMVAFHSRE
jgi:DNA-binding PadR family transcriptional regulator